MPESFPDLTAHRGDGSLVAQIGTYGSGTPACNADFLDETFSTLPLLPEVDYDPVAVTSECSRSLSPDTSGTSRDENSLRVDHHDSFSMRFGFRIASDFEAVCWFEMRSATNHESEVPSAEAAIYAAMDLLGQKWVLRVIWELEPGPLGFLELRRRMGNCSSSVLADRLNTLGHAGIVQKLADKSYELTAHGGAELGVALESVWQWADTRSDALTGVPGHPDTGAVQNARRRA